MSKSHTRYNIVMSQLLLVLVSFSWTTLPVLADEEASDHDSEIKQQIPYSFNDVADNLVIIECKSERGDSAGSGFVVKVDGKTYIYTNQHVIMGADTISFMTANGERLRPKAVELAATRDIARLLIDDREALEIGDSVAMGIPLAVFGNSEGGGVATELFGKVTGVGADLLEVTAEFVSGNSGSPVLNEDKQVIGIASYVRFTPPSRTNKDTEYENKARRFCYRLTNVRWVAVNWRQYNEQYGKAYRDAEEVVDSIFDVIKGWYNDPFGAVPDNMADADLKKWSTEHNRMVSHIVKLSDKGQATVSELNNTNKRIRNDITDSAEALSVFCQKRARQLEFKFKRSQDDLTGFLRDELDGYVQSLDYASESIDYFGTKLATIDYFSFKSTSY